MKRSNRDLMLNAYHNQLVIPAFNIPYLPMVEPIARALIDVNAFGFIAVARPEWERFEARSQRAVRDEYLKYYREPWMRLHQDHVPVVDETGARVDYLAILQEAVDLGYDSIMVDGSRLPLEENIAVTRQVIALAAPHGIPVEAEVGAVLGHEAGPLPPYEELFRSGQGFTAVEDATQFVQRTGVDWLSVACGNIHGAIQGAAKDSRKVEARLNIEHLAQLRDAAGVPLVLHGGSGIRKESILAGVATGIAKINIGTDVRQPYEQGIRAGEGVAGAQARVYERTVELLRDVLELEDSRDTINPPLG
ncbi:MAG: class II fructose-bisphosphate aldolase [Anaerolineales bacterium]|nr:class II fructose-bisphosphate aldolase [Anaerolineales bacterium]